MAMSFKTLPGITDIDGNTYSIIQIGTQTWLGENLKTTKHNDGTALPLVKDSIAWSNLTTPGYCWYNNNVATNKATYGALYNWYTVNTGKLCPIGWHVPSNGEWITLTTFLGGESVAGGKLKETGTTHWESPNTGATNESGFTSLPGGGRNSGGLSDSQNGTFAAVRWTGTWWTSSEFTNHYVYGWVMKYNQSNVQYTNLFQKTMGCSVRCVKN